MVKSLPLEGVRYLPLNAILSFNRPVTFVISSKGDGKSIHTLLWRVNQFLRYGKRTIWTRTNDAQITSFSMMGFFSVLESLLARGDLHCFGNQLPKFKVKVSDHMALGYVNGKVAFFVISLNAGQKFLGNGIPNQEDYDCIVVDECLVNPAKGEREIKGMVDKYKTITSTIFRKRPYRQVFLGNAYTTASDWFQSFEPIDFRHIRFNAVTAPKGKPWCIYWGVPAKHLEEVRESAYAKASPMSALDQSSVLGKFYLDNSALIIDPKSVVKNCPIANFEMDGKRFGLWLDLKTGNIVVSATPCPGKASFVPVETDTAKEAYIIRSQRQSYWWSQVRQARMANTIRYESPYILRLFVQFWDKFLI